MSNFLGTTPEAYWCKPRKGNDLNGFMDLYLQSASERRWNNFNGFTDFYLKAKASKAKASIWLWLSFMLQIRSAALNAMWTK